MATSEVAQPAIVTMPRAAPAMIPAAVMTTRSGWISRQPACLVEEVGAVTMDVKQ